jgi:putative transposase
VNNNPLRPRSRAIPSSITLRADQRNRLLDSYRRHPDPAVRLRAHIILLLSEGYAWSAIAAVLFCSTRTIGRWQKRFRRGGVDALLGEPRGRPTTGGGRWVAVLVVWVTTTSPRAFGFLRSRWCCEALALVLLWVHQVDVGRETVRRWLHQGQLVWRRPRPVVGPRDPDREAVLRQLRRLARHLPDDEVIVFQDEVDINLNPKIGPMWTPRGQQAEVVTPGDNEKRYLAGSLNARTGALVVTKGAPRQGRNADLFVRHLEDLRVRLRRYRVIHVLCDNARAHDCKKVTAYLAEHGDRIKVHYLPRRAPECNPIERVWWHLHDEITRNHTCKDMQELLRLVFDWLYSKKRHPIEGSVWPLRKTG